MVRELLMISAAFPGVSIAATVMTPATAKSQAQRPESYVHMMSPGRCGLCYCPRYVLRGNGFCGCCGHSFCFPTER